MPHFDFNQLNSATKFMQIILFKTVPMTLCARSDFIEKTLSFSVSYMYVSINFLLSLSYSLFLQSKEKMMKGVRRGCVRLKDALIGIDDQEENTFTITVDHKTFHFQAS